MLDVGWGDLIDYLGDDPHTRSIVIYMESIGDARSFLSAAREVALNKPIIVIKAGRIRGGGQGRGFAHRIALRQRRRAGCGLPPLRRSAGRPTSAISSTCPRFSPSSRGREGPRLDDSQQCRRPGSAGHRCSDRGRRASWRNWRLRRWKRSIEILPPHWSHQNPIDIIGDAGPDRYAQRDGNRGQGSEQRRPSGHPEPAGNDESRARSRSVSSRTQSSASRCWPVGWAAIRWPRAKAS